MKTNNDNWCIYGLYDPRVPITLSSVRYIGKTSQSLRERMRKHLKAIELKTMTHKNNWIKKLLVEGVTPEIVVLVDGSEMIAWQEMEMRMIDLALKSNAQLTNGTRGGDGGNTWSGKHHTELQKIKMSLAMKGRKHTKEHTAHWLESRLNYKHSEETKRKIGQARLGKPHHTKGGWKFTEETKLRQAEARKRWWDRKRILEQELKTER